MLTKSRTAFLMFALVALVLPQSAAAGSINVSGQVSFVGFFTGHVSLTGTREFSLEAGTAALWGFVGPLSGLVFSPGSLISLNAGLVGNAYFGPTAALEDVTYTGLQWNLCVSAATCTTLNLSFFGGSIPAPAILPAGSTATFSTPVSFAGTFIHADELGTTLVHEELLATARGTVSMFALTHAEAWQ